MSILPGRAASQTAETSTFSDAVADYCLALLNTNAFSYID
jgi:hypothetical protein